MPDACSPGADRPFHCPTKWELWRQLMALMPRGRAWQSHEHVVERWESGWNSQVETFEAGATPLGAEPTIERLTVMQQYWAAFAEVLEYLHTRACALIEEFFCATTAEQRLEWGIDYGFPDQCEPWETLCDKVAAVGGATCAYLAGIAATHGIVIECEETGHNAITIRILSGLSPSIEVQVPYEAGCLEAGCTPPCDESVAVVLCLIERWKPAHVRATYEVA